MARDQWRNLFQETVFPRWRYGAVAGGAFAIALTITVLGGSFRAESADSQFGLGGVTLSASAAEGADLFASYCTDCHGTSGDRIPVSPLASLTFLDSRGDASLLATTADGKDTMPAFSLKRDGPLDDEQIRSVVAFLNARAGRGSVTLLAADGQHLYEQLCVECHGASGARIPIAPLAAKGFLDVRTDAELQGVILDGRGTMGGLGSEYDPRDAAAIAAFLRYRVEANTVESISHGRDLYVESCLSCHGASGDRVGGVNLASAPYLSTLGNGTYQPATAKLAMEVWGASDPYIDQPRALESIRNWLPLTAATVLLTVWASLTFITVWTVNGIVRAGAGTRSLD